MNALKILLLLIPLLYGQVLGQSAKKAQDELLRFSTFLRDRGEYARSAAELQRYQFFASQTNDSLQLQIGYDYLCAGLPDKASCALGKIMARPESHFYLTAVLYSSLLEFQAENYHQSLFWLERLNTYHLHDRTLAQKEYLESANYLLLHESQKGRVALTTVSKDQNSFYSKFQNLVDKADNVPHKSPIKAALFSTVIPGLGKFYVGKKIDGLYTLLLLGATSYMAYSGFEENRTTKGWVFSGISALFYVGNIHGSYVSAIVHNQQRQHNFEMGVHLAIDALFFDTP